jgi:S1-C subfamily serine protease
MVSPDMAVTTGSLTTLSGGRGDSRQIEFSAPVQPGNSGGPVLDDAGRLIGVTEAVLNGLAVAVLTGGAVPQNVNFAIKSDIAEAFLSANHVGFANGPSHAPMEAAEVAELARRFTVKLECWR